MLPYSAVQLFAFDHIPPIFLRHVGYGEIHLKPTALFITQNAKWPSDCCDDLHRRRSPSSTHKVMIVTIMTGELHGSKS